MKYKKKVLKNGTRLITIHNPETPTATVMVMVEAGSDFETDNQSGLSHFLEHMCFKGTSTRDYHQIAYDLDSVGAESNAFTSKQFTGYYAKAHASKLDKLMGVISDIYLNSTFPSEEIEKEKGVIVEEMKMYNDLPQRKVWDLWDQVLYDGQSAGRSIIGNEKTVRSFNQKDFIDYKEKFYTPESTVILVSGNFNEKEVYKFVNKIFGSLDSKKKPKFENVKNTKSNKKIIVENRKSDQAHLVLGFKTAPAKSDDGIVLDLLATVLGRGFSSRLFKKMRDELGLCYYVRADHDAYRDRGFFTVNAGVSILRVDEAVKEICKELQKTLSEPILEKEIKKAKEFFIGNHSIALETTDDQAQYFGIQEMLQVDILKPAEFYKKIKSVKDSDIKRVLRKYLKPDNMYLAGIGPIKNTKNIENYIQFKDLNK